MWAEQASSARSSTLTWHQTYATRRQLRSGFDLDNDDWLSESERRELTHWRNADRREAWLCGRWASKQLIRALMGERDSVSVPAGPAHVEPDGYWDRRRAQGQAELALPQISITSRDDQGRSVRPHVSICGRSLPWSVSISHSQRAVLVAVSTAPEIVLGVDLTDINAIEQMIHREPQASAPSWTTGFQKTWFTNREQETLVDAGPETTAAVWAVKEAVYKASNRGEGFAPRRIELCLEPTGFRCQYDGVKIGDDCEIVVRELDRHAAATVLLNRRSVRRNRASGPGRMSVGGSLGTRPLADKLPASRSPY